MRTSTPVITTATLTNSALNETPSVYAGGVFASPMLTMPSATKMA
jgi:hypothetical protein